MGEEAVGTVIGGYRIEAVIGVGGMSTVYRARHPRLPRSDALKVLSGLAISQDPTARRRFEREASRVAGLTHPNIVRIYDSGTDDTVSWLSMELIEGTDALGLLKEHPGGLPLPQAVELVRAIAEALDHSHRHGVQHRDVKPGNILVDRSRSTVRYALGDFGIARASTDPRMTQSGTVLGTVDYCSPEQLADQPLDGSCDQYSLAATTVHLLSGQRPYGTAGVATIAHRQLTAQPPRPSELRPDLPPEVDAVIARAMSKEPADRYPDCRTFAVDLSAALLPPTALQGPDSDSTTGGRSPRRARLAAAHRKLRGWAAPRRRRRAMAAVAAIAATVAVVTAATDGFRLSGSVEGTGDGIAADAGNRIGTGRPGADETAPASSGSPPLGRSPTEPAAVGGSATTHPEGPVATAPTDDALDTDAFPGSADPADPPAPAPAPAPEAGDHAPVPADVSADPAPRGAAAPVPLASSPAVGGSGQPGMRDAAGVIDPCRVPESVLISAGLSEMHRGTAPGPVRDCFARLRSDPDRTIEFVFYPSGASGPEADASRTAFAYAPATESGWRAYRTSVIVLGDRYVYCSVGRMIPGEGLFEIYTLSDTTDSTSGEDSTCSRLIGLADDLTAAIGAI